MDSFDITFEHAFEIPVSYKVDSSEEIAVPQDEDYGSGTSIYCIVA